MQGGRKGVILAGGTGSRLYPATAFTGKQLLPVYDKPMLYYPLSTLLSAGIGDILVITNSSSLDPIRRNLGDGSLLGARVTYALQSQPRGIAEALIIAEKCGFWSGRDPLVLILGDNIFDWKLLPNNLREALQKADCRQATVFASRVSQPQRYGVLSEGGIVEKPESPESGWAVTGLYVYPAGACEIAISLSPSARGELEITDVNNHYFADERLHVCRMDWGCQWFDAGTPDDLLAASQYVAAVQKRQGRLVGSPELAAVQGGLLSVEELRRRERDATSYWRSAVLANRALP